MFFKAEALTKELSLKESHLESRLKDVEITKAALAKKQTELSQQEKELIQLEDELKTLKLEAEAGFSREHKQALEGKRKALFEVEQVHNQNLQKDIDSVRQFEAKLLERERELDALAANAKAGFVLNKMSIRSISSPRSKKQRMR